jgi:hypothetical protein
MSLFSTGTYSMEHIAHALRFDPNAKFHKL